MTPRAGSRARRPAEYPGTRAANPAHDRAAPCLPTTIARISPVDHLPLAARHRITKLVSNGEIPRLETVLTYLESARTLVII